ncbi:MAG: hypothetical protein GX877_06390 [Bacteroidales bacterium]|nr:hypothetical protein [Bacteroidales bacterium]
MKPISHIRYSLIRSVPLLILGIFLLINPEGSISTLIRLLAAILLVGGLFSLYYAWSDGRNADLDKGLRGLLYMTALVFMVFAVLLLLFPNFFATLGMFLSGLILFLFSVTQITGVIRFRKAVPIGLPWYLYLNPVAMLILSVVIMIDPFQSAKILVVFTGIICLLYAITEGIQAIVSYRLFKRSNTGSK